MNFRNLMRNKGLVFAVTAMVIIFLLFLLVISTIQKSSISYLRHVDTIDGMVQRVDSGLYKGKSDVLKQDVNQIKSNSGFKAPIPSQLDSVVKKLNDGFSTGSDSIKQDLLALQNSIKVESDKKSQLAKYMQFAAAILLVIFLLLIVFPLISRLAKNEDTGVEAKKEAEGIMNTVSEGLFLLSKNNEFGLEQSASLRQMFRFDRDLEGNFFDFIGNYVPESTVQVAQDYLGLLYGDRVKEKLVKDLNPLNEVEISIPRRDGSLENRYLDFKFNRVMENDELSHLLGSVTDVTREVMLKQELEDSKEEQEAQLDLLMNILHIDSGQLNNFFENADKTLLGINEELEAKGHSDSDIRRKLKEIYENAHRIKGDAAALGLHKFEFGVHEFEESIDEVQKNKNISGKHLLPTVSKLKELFSDLQNMRGLVSKFAENYQGGSAESALTSESETQAPQVVLNEYSKLEQPLHNIVSTVAERSDKRAVLKTYGLDKTVHLPEKIAEIITSVGVQLIRNSIVHGGLLPVERLAQNKSDFLNITTSLTETDKGYTFIVRDDGEGLDEKAIIEKAVNLGYVDKDKVDGLTPNDVVNFLFRSGFSTKDDADLDGGRGVGLNSVYTMVIEAGGVLSMRYKNGVYCQFQAFFPQ